MNYENIIVMKVGPHSGMSLEEIIDSKIREEKLQKVHYWGYSGVFCHPNKVQKFCEEVNNKPVKLVLIETKSNYDSKIGYINYYSIDGINYEKFNDPVQLQGAQYSFVAQNIEVIENFSLENYLVVGGKNNGKPLPSHLKFRVNKSFAKLNNQLINDNLKSSNVKVLIADLVYPYAIWLKDK